MKGYKAFNPGLICRGKQYAENTVFEEPTAVICRSGMHFCKAPLDVLEHYPLINDNGELNEFAEVEALDEVKTDDNKKYTTKKLKIGAKISLKRLGELHAEYVSEVIKAEGAVDSGYKSNQVGGYESNQVGGNCSNQVGGNCSKQIGGYKSNQVGGYESNQVGGNCSNQVGGYESNQVGGNCSNQVGGDCSKQIGGNESKQVGGDWSNQVGGYKSNQVGGYESNQVGGNCSNQVGGDCSKQIGGDWSKKVGGNESKQVGGKNSVMVAGEGSCFKAGLHSVILHYWYDGNGNIGGFKAAQIDGVNLQPDTWYKLVNGDFVKAD